MVGAAISASLSAVRRPPARGRRPRLAARRLLPGVVRALVIARRRLQVALVRQDHHPHRASGLRTSRPRPCVLTGQERGLLIPRGRSLLRPCGHDDGPVAEPLAERNGTQGLLRASGATADVVAWLRWPEGRLEEELASRECLLRLWVSNGTRRFPPCARRWPDFETAGARRGRRAATAVSG